MKRKWNWPLWVGFVVAVGFLFVFFAYETFYVLRQVPLSAQAPRIVAGTGAEGD